MPNDDFQTPPAADDELNLSDRFPEMRPVSGVPALWTVNGIGTTMYGERDLDGHTQTYIKTLCLTVLFVPLFCLSAYRVADAEDGGWYFLGKEPLSMLSKIWNALVVFAGVAVVGGIFWSGYVGSAEYQAGQEFDRAEESLEFGEVVTAAEVYRDLGTGTSSYKSKAAQRFVALFDGPLDRATMSEAAEVFAMAVELQQAGQESFAVANLPGLALQRAKTEGPEDVPGAVDLLAAVAPLIEDPAEINELRLTLLKPYVEAHPENRKMALRLARIHEFRQEWEACEALLMRHRDSLKGTDGARMLGQILARRGEFELSHELLMPYTQQRLEELHMAESRFDQIYEAEAGEILRELNMGTAVGFSYSSFDQRSEADQEAMVNEYIAGRLEGNQVIEQARRNYFKLAAVVPVALDLGMVQLQRGQNASDPEVRQRELERAEKTFLSIQGAAGDSDEYKKYLGQVYYWLGRADEGRQQFDELLAKGRTFPRLFAVAMALRDLGNFTEARVLLEEAYEASDERNERQQAAWLRALSAIDLDDRITWLERADQSQPRTKASFLAAQASLALEEGNQSLAEKYSREAISVHQAQPETVISLNDLAVAFLDLYALTNEPSDYSQGLDYAQRAVNLSASDSILQGNFAAAALGAACLDVAQDRIDLKQADANLNVRLLYYLFLSQAEREAMVEQVRQNRWLKESVASYERLLVLAPEGSHVYSALNSIHTFLLNEEELRDLLQRCQEADLDLSASRAKVDEYRAGTDDEEIISSLNVHIKKMEAMIEASRDNDKIAFAIVSCGLSSSLRSLDALGQEIDMDRMVQLAEQAHEAAPSSATSNTLIGALMTRAHHALLSERPGYAELADEFGRSLTGDNILLFALSRGDDLSKLIVANDDVQRCSELHRRRIEVDPDAQGTYAWAFFKNIDSQLAEQIADYVKQDEVSRLSRALNRVMGPWDTSTVLSIYWTQQILGDEAQAAEVLRQGREAGAIIPAVK